MANCDINQLIADAKCFECLSPGEQQIVELQLLCAIAQNGGGGGTVDCDPIAARVSRASGLSVPGDSTYTVIPWESEDVDTDDMVDIVGAPNVITIKEDGLYFCNALVPAQPSEDSNGALHSTIFKNGNFLGVGSTLVADAVDTVSPGFDKTQTPAGLIQCVAGDFIWVGVRSNTGQTDAVNASEFNPALLNVFKVVGCLASS